MSLQLHIKEHKLKKSEILKDLKKAIKYFDFKKQFAKNKEYHVHNVNLLIKAFNFLENQTETNLINTIDTLLIIVFFQNLDRYENTQTALERTIFTIKNKKYTYDFYAGIMCGNYLNKTVKDLLKKKELPEAEKIQKILDTSFVDVFITDVLNKIKKII